MVQIDESLVFSCHVSPSPMTDPIDQMMNQCLNGTRTMAGIRELLNQPTNQKGRAVLFSFDCDYDCDYDYDCDCDCVDCDTGCRTDCWMIVIPFPCLTGDRIRAYPGGYGYDYAVHQW